MSLLNCGKLILHGWVKRLHELSDSGGFINFGVVLKFNKR